MKFLYFIILVGLAAFTTGCKKERHEEKDFCRTGQLVSSRFYHSDNSSYEVAYQYDLSGKLLLEKEYLPDGTAVLIREYVYENNRLVRIKLGQAAEHRFFYTGDHLTRSEYVDLIAGPNKQHFERIFVYKGDTLIKIFQNDLIGGTPGISHLLHHDGENIVRVTKLNTQTGAVLDDEFFEYDLHINPFYNELLNTGNAKYSSKNNILRIITTVKNGIAVQEELKYAYHYNLQGRPVKQYLLFQRTGVQFLEQVYNYCSETP